MQDFTFPIFAEPSTKKRKRHVIALACEPCRTSHTKCDGSMPCGRCVKRRLQCDFCLDRAKRGPKRGADKQKMEIMKTTFESQISDKESQIMSLERERNELLTSQATLHQLLAKLNGELEKEKLQTLTWKQKYDALLCHMQLPSDTMYIGFNGDDRSVVDVLPTENTYDSYQQQPYYHFDDNVDPIF
jgi:hypothetical protein